MTDRKWQYKVVLAGGGVFTKAEKKVANIEETLNRLGLERWELVSVNKSYGETATTLTFKRPF